MNLHRIIALSRRSVLQIIQDRRSIALIIIAPLIIMSLVGFSFIDKPKILNTISPALIASFSLFLTFMLTAVSFLRERQLGTLERLTTTPVRTFEILIGYLISFYFFAIIQSLIVVFFTIFVLGIDYQGEIWQMLLIVLIITFVAVNLGILISTFAKNEFQIIQFNPIIIAPQIFLSGLILPVSELPSYFQVIAKIIPLRYAVDCLQGIMLKGNSLNEISNDLIILSGFGIIFLCLATLTIRHLK